MTGLRKGDLFRSRKATDEHKTRITAELTLSSQFDELYAHIFDHHAPEDFSPSLYHTSGLVTPAKVTHMFHTEHFRPKVFVGLQRGPEISVDELFDRISKSPIDKDSLRENRVGPNRVSAIIGRIGVGKTTLLAHIEIQSRMKMTREKIWSLRMDVERVAGQSVDRLVFFRELFLKLCAAAEHRNILPSLELRQLAAACAPGAGLSSSELESEMYALGCRRFVIEIYKRTNLRILLFLDNVDRYYYLFDRSAYSPEGDKYRQQACEKLAAIIGAFDSPGGWMDGAGLCVVVCLRRHTLEYLIATGFALPGERFTSEGNQNIFRVSKVPAQEVLRSRMELLAACLKLLPNDPDRRAAEARATFFSTTLSTATPDITGHKPELGPKNRTMIEDLARLSNHGHRSLVEHLATYKWCMNDDILAPRFFKTYAPPILTFILRNFSRYSQSECRFPNMFLVRGDSEVNFEETVPGRLSSPHRHTYWLKYLIAKFIYTGQQKGFSVTPRDVLDVFCPEPDGRGCFERHITELLLGSLQQIDVSAVTEPKFLNSLANTNLAVKDLAVTQRGEFLLDRFVFEFFYLQLVIEDYLLEFPAKLVDQFQYVNLDYSYLVAKHGDYAGSIRDMIAEKSRQVFMFLMLLECSLESERRRHKEVFQKLEQRGVLLPDLRDIRAEILAVILSLMHYLARSTGFESAEDIARAAMERAELRRTEIAGWFRYAYEQMNV